MVRNRLLPFSIVIVVFSFMLLGLISAQTRTYQINQQWVKIWINENGSIDLSYNISITLEAGPDINRVYVGQPAGDFTIGNASDQNGRSLTVADASSGSDYKVQVNLASPLAAGETVWFTVITKVANMIYEDNATNVGMEFRPTWWEEAVVRDLRVLIVLPVGVNSSAVGANVNWDNIRPELDGRLGVYWQRQDLAPNQQYEFGVSFPKGFTSYETRSSGLQAFLEQFAPALLGIGFVAAVIVVIVLIIRKKAYLSPTVSIETLGIKHGLTAVEASYLLDLKPTKIVTEILYSLLKKRAVWVEATKPSLKLRIMPEFQNRTGPAEDPLRYYEIDFLNAIKDDGKLSEEKLAGTVMSLRDNVEEKMHGYCRRDTIDYYNDIVAKAWQQVEQAGAPELASNAYDEQLLWLLLDPNVQAHTQTAFHDRAFEPNPLWLWYWYGYTHYHPHPTYKPSTEIPTSSAKPPSIPGADFANNIATSLESTTNNIVVNIEKFANSIIPAPAAKASTEPTHHNATCVCACHACACACACVSCACACAGGGVG